MNVVKIIAPQASELLADLDTLRAKIASGELPTTTLLVIGRDRVNETTSFTLCGETLAYSHIVGLLALISHDLCGQSQS